MEKELKEKDADKKLSEIISLIKEGKIKLKGRSWYHKLFGPIYLKWLRFCDKYLRKEKDRFSTALKRLKKEIEKNKKLPT
jgi:exonuclease I